MDLQKEQNDTFDITEHQKQHTRGIDQVLKPIEIVSILSSCCKLRVRPEKRFNLIKLSVQHYWILFLFTVLAVFDVKSVELFRYADGN